jgi:PilZ domain
MLRDEANTDGAASREEGSSSSEASTPRRSQRRKLPFGRGGVLRVDGRSHIVGVVDVSVGGAYLATRTVLPPARSLSLKLRLPSGIELSLACEVLRVSQQADESQAHPRGIAVRFQELDALARKYLEEFVAIDRPVNKERANG